MTARGEEEESFDLPKMLRMPKVPEDRSRVGDFADLGTKDFSLTEITGNTEQVLSCFFSLCALCALCEIILAPFALCPGFRRVGDSADLGGHSLLRADSSVVALAPVLRSSTATEDGKSEADTAAVRGPPYEKPCGMGFTPFNPSYGCSSNSSLSDISHPTSHIASGPSRASGS